VRLRFRQHPLDICRAGAVAAANPVVSREPYIAGPSDRVCRYFRARYRLTGTGLSPAGSRQLRLTHRN
jgi:hypothetical protein